MILKGEEATGNSLERGIYNTEKFLVLDNWAVLYKIGSQEKTINQNAMDKELRWRRNGNLECKELKWRNRSLECALIWSSPILLSSPACK